MLEFVILGIIIGAFVSNIFHYAMCGHGIITIDHSDPETESYNFKVNKLDDLNKKTRFILHVEHVSQK